MSRERTTLGDGNWIESSPSVSALSDVGASDDRTHSPLRNITSESPISINRGSDQNTTQDAVLLTDGGVSQPQLCEDFRPRETGITAEQGFDPGHMNSLVPERENATFRPRPKTVGPLVYFPSWDHVEDVTLPPGKLGWVIGGVETYLEERTMDEPIPLPDSYTKWDEQFGDGSGYVISKSQLRLEGRRVWAIWYAEYVRAALRALTGGGHYNTDGLHTPPHCPACDARGARRNGVHRSGHGGCRRLGVELDGLVYPSTNLYAARPSRELRHNGGFGMTLASDEFDEL
jgi:hypothetical protein